MSKLKLVFDGRVLGQRGVGRYSATLLKSLAATAHAMEVLVVLGPRSDAGLVPQDPRFETHRLGGTHPAWAEQVALPGLARAWGADLIHYTDNTAALLPGLPVVLTMHDTMWRRPLGEAVLRPTLRQRFQDAYRKFVCPRAARVAAVVMTVSEFSKADLSAGLGLDPRKIVVAPNSLDEAIGHRLPAAEALKARRSLGVLKPYVLCSGAADRRKNIERLIHAFALAQASGPLAGSELVVTSLRPGELATTGYVEATQRAGIPDKVRFLGYVNDRQMTALYQGCHLYAFPSLWEGFGLPVLEAYALGCSVLAARAGALPEVAGTGAVLADPLSVEDLAQGLRQAARPVSALRRRAMRTQLALFTPARSAGLHWRAYQRALGRA